MLVAPSLVSSNSPASHLKSAKNKITLPVPSQFAEGKSRVATAIVYCEANFDEIDGKTANGLICLDLAGAQAQVGLIPDLFIFGMEV